MPINRKFGGSNGYGYNPDPKGHKVSSAHILLGTSDTPKSASLKDFVPSVLDQVNTSSCTGQAVKGAIITRMNKRGTPIDPPSAGGIYRIGRAIDRLPNFDDSLPPLEDDGAMPNQIMRGITEWGVPSEASDPFNPKTINDEPTLGTLIDASDCKLDGYYRVNWLDIQRRVNALRLAIHMGYPPCFAIDVDNKFEEYSDGVLGAPNPNGILGGHYMYAVAYDTTSTGYTIIEFVNSWGESWGVAGFGFGDEKFIGNMRDIYVMDVKLKGE